MPIKNFTTGQIPYLENYKPYGDINEAVSISDMIAYDLTPNPFATRIDYTLGSEDLYVKTLNIKNITTNAEIELTVVYSRIWFYLNFINPLITRDVGIDRRAVTLILKPLETTKIDILLNNSSVDLASERNVLSDIVVNVRNLPNGQIITRAANVQGYTTVNFPARVRIE